MRKLVAIYVLTGSTMISVAQTIAPPQGAGTVVFESAGGKWQKAIITDQFTHKTSSAYSLDAETSRADLGTGRRPRIAFSCEGPSMVDHVRIRTGTVIGSSQLSTRNDDQAFRTRTADIAQNGSDFLIDRTIISEFMAHKRFVVRFASASGAAITDEYLTNGLSVESLRSDCPALLEKR
jgi:hypothetical protein